MSLVISVPISSERDPHYQHIPSQCYIKLMHHEFAIYHKDLVVGSIKASLYEMTFTCLMLASILTSLIAFSLSLSDRCPNLTFFKA